MPARNTNPALRVLNWGMGQDSTTILLMSHHGELPPFDAVLVADTQQEPVEVYETMKWVMALVQVPIYRVTVGDLGAACLGYLRNNPPASRPQIPFYVAGSNGKASPLRRGCTEAYKIKPIRKKLRELLGIAPQKHIPKTCWVEQAIGFPLEELGRTFCSDVAWISNTFPLIDKRMRKHDCERWLRDHGYPTPIPKSSCRFCPYHNNAYWRRMRDTQPKDWAKTVAFEAALHRGKLPGVRGTPYLHRSMVPLAMAPIDELETGQEELFCFACNT
jgi:hypothetical protein